MHLVTCARPSGVLEEAPGSSLRPESDGDCWDGFWCAGDEAYYTRCIRHDGSEEWFRVADDEAAAPAAASDPVVVPLRPRAAAARRRVMLLVGRSGGATGVLVGTAHRKSR